MTGGQRIYTLVDDYILISVIKVALDVIIILAFGIAIIDVSTQCCSFRCFTDKIDRKQEYVYSYQEKLTNQFNYMDQMIAQMNAQFTTMQQQLASIGVNMGSSS